MGGLQSQSGKYGEGNILKSFAQQKTRGRKWYTTRPWYLLGNRPGHAALREQWGQFDSNHPQNRAMEKEGSPIAHHKQSPQKITNGHATLSGLQLFLHSISKRTCPCFMYFSEAHSYIALLVEGK
jgi:hypothetical protein